MNWPDGKAFAFTVFDDTDNATIENVGEVYRLLDDLGLRTTKSVWPSEGQCDRTNCGDTCEDPDYLEWLFRLRSRGFEIGYHMNACSTSTREQTIQGLEQFGTLFGGPPKAMANHSECRENIYWGSDRLSGLNRLVYDILTGYRNHGRYRGHREGDPLFWGDLCRERIKYCRGFVFPEINTLAACPFMPYHDPKRPYVNYWYASSEGATLESYLRLLSEANLDSLEAAAGACIVYTHFASGFYHDGTLDARFRTLMESLAGRNGWYVTVSELLDYLMEQNGSHEITSGERRHLEWKWLRHKFRVGTT